MAQKKSGKKKSGTPKNTVRRNPEKPPARKRKRQRKKRRLLCVFCRSRHSDGAGCRYGDSSILRENAGAAGGAFGSALLGLFSVSAYLIPVYMLAFAIFFRRLAEENVLGRRVALCIAVHFILSMLCHVFFGGAPLL